MTLPLQEADYVAIRTLYKRTKDKRVANYLNIILLKHKGYSQVAIADILQLDENTKCTWVAKFESVDTLESYLLVHYTAYLGKLNYCSLGKVTNFIANHTCCDTKPIIEAIRVEFDVKYSVSGITKLLHRVGFSYKQKVSLPSKLDTAKQAEFVKKYDEIVQGVN